MPPASPPPGASSGEVCTLSIATRRITAFLPESRSRSPRSIMPDRRGVPSRCQRSEGDAFEMRLRPEPNPELAFDTGPDLRGQAQQLGCRCPSAIRECERVLGRDRHLPAPASQAVAPLESGVL